MRHGRAHAIVVLLACGLAACRGETKKPDGDSDEQRSRASDAKKEPRRGAPAASDEAPRSLPVAIGEPAEPEASPVATATRALLDGYTQGAVELRETALGFERLLAEKQDGTFKPAPGWEVSERRATAHALLTASKLLQDDCQAVQDAHAAADAATITTTDLMARNIRFAHRYPNASAAGPVWTALREAREAAPHELADVSGLASPVPQGGFILRGIRVKADGDDGLVAEDVDGNPVWEHRGHATSEGEVPTARVLGAVRERLIVLELRATSECVLEGIDLSTGNDLFRVPLFMVDASTKGHFEPILFALSGSDAIVAASGRIAVVDVFRGALAWRRSERGGLPQELLADRIVLGTGFGGAEALDLWTGRRVSKAAPATAKKKPGIEIR
jgi:hypothetical protein